MSQLAVLLQESEEREPGVSAGGTAVFTILRLLREEMDGLDLGIRRKKSLKERMGLKGMGGCCGGPIWGFGSTAMPVLEVDDDSQEEEGAAEGDAEIHHQLPQEEPPPASEEDRWAETRSHPNTTVCGSEDPSGGASAAGMNLAAALAAERQYRALQEPEPEGASQEGLRDVNVVGGTGGGGGTPSRVSLMRLLEEADGGEEAEEKSGGGGESMCCVCMGRKKGAAFIPCGHTYCRVCSRELWLNRGSCPLCNRAILEILDIF